MGRGEGGDSYMETEADRRIRLTLSLPSSKIKVNSPNLKINTL